MITTPKALVNFRQSLITTMIKKENMSETIALARQVITMEIQSLETMANRIDQAFEKAIDLIYTAEGRVVVVGMGKSGLIGKKIAATMASTGTAAFSVHPAEAFHGDLGMIRPGDVALMISNSGETEELVRLLPFLEHQKNRIVAMTGKKDSTLGRHAQVVLDVSVDREACNNNLAPTSSTTATLVMGDALAVVLSTKRNFQPEDFARFHPGGNLGRRLLTRVADMMQSDNLPFCRQDDPFKDVIHVINRGRLGLALVMDGDVLVGLITDGDIRRAFDSEKDYKLIQAKDMMTINPKTALPEERFADAETRIRAAKVSALVVKSEEGKIVGVLQIFDLISSEPAA
jgi:arabinose-5-phosphate isomerase